LLEKEVVDKAIKDEKVRKYLESNFAKASLDKEKYKVIYVRGKILNLVLK